MRTICIVACAVMLSSCGADSDSSSSSGDAATQPPPSPNATPTAENNGSFLLTGSDTTISGISVPPPPSDAANATPGGVDSDANGVRDDVDRLVALAFGSNPQAYSAAVTAAKRLQAMVAPDALSASSIQSLVDAGVEQARCLATSSFGGDYSAASHAMQIVIGATLNTPARIKLYQDRVSQATSVIDVDFQRACS